MNEMQSANAPVVFTATTNEPMVDAKQAACALQLPLYWFNDPKMRTKHRIPHYQLGCLVRFRMQELFRWAAQNAADQGEIATSGKDNGHVGL